MAAVTVTTKGESTRFGRVLRFSGAGAADTAATLTTPTVPVGSVWHLMHVTAVYASAVTQTGVTTTLDSELGATYDALLNTGTANATNTVYLPTPNLMWLPGDAIVVTAPANTGGGSIAATITVTVRVE